MLTAHAVQSFIDPGLSWKDIKWFKSITKSGLFSSPFSSNF